MRTKIDVYVEDGVTIWKSGDLEAHYDPVGSFVQLNSRVGNGSIDIRPGEIDAVICLLRMVTEDAKTSKTIEEESYDFDKTGLGIGGAPAHDLQSETLELVARGELKVVEKESRGPLPDGQLWEPCEVRGCNNEPVCVNCFRCEKHCEC
jgi:hypothetical protein